MRTMMRQSFTATPSRLPPDGVRTVRNPRLYRSADYPYDVDTPTGPVAAPTATATTKAVSEQQAKEAAGSIGKAIADSLGSLFGKKPPAPKTVAEKRARDVTLWVVAGVAVGAVVLVLRSRK